ncbi:MAG: hypothetical protein HDR13_16410 [Lachnospiraceae bacterium]|nr:hypothetical protein [Lachnospiraceae bacterium]
MNINQNQYGPRVGYYPEYGRSYGKNYTENEEATSFADRLGEGQKTVGESAKAGEDAKDKKQDDATESKSYREQILEKMEEMAQNIKKGTIQPKFKIGAQEYTIKEWEKLLEKFDAAEEALREEVEAMIEEIKKQAEAEALRREAESGMHDPKETTYVSETTETQTVTEVTGVPQQPAAGVTGTDTIKTEEIGTEEAAALLTDEITKCSYPTDNPEQKHWYITCYGQNGISCKEAYFDGTRWVNKDLWSFSYTEKGQYEKVMAFLERFPQDANLRFAAHENFWKDFLAGEINEDEFVSFFETTKDGVPDYTYEKDGSTYIDREKVKYAKYMNDFGTRFYTGEEMELIRRGVMHENRKQLTRMSDYNGKMTIPEGVGGDKDSEEEDEIETKLITKPDGSTVLQIKTAYGVMELEVTQAQKFGLMIDVRHSIDRNNISSSEAS